MTLFFCNCKKEKVISDADFEQTVFYEIFPAILDSIYYDKRLPPPPPPSSEFFAKEEYKNNIDKAVEDYMKSDKFKNQMEKRKRKKDSLKSDKSPIFIVVSDSASAYEKDDATKLSDHFKIQDSINVKLGLNYRIDLNMLISNDEKIKFKYRSEFPKGREFWKTEYDYFIAANIGFSRILFDESKAYGVLNGGYTTGILNGNGFRIFIKKNENGNWAIDKIIGTWMS
ncbi:hypothetical protein PXD56_01455 [Maribacter sp. SA7]|uniref:hypothetical protein n=1 Tax=Maribacter zhoushanensis TaxID=3030012 RepID=UPI0023EADA4E|nr:hypothetical protein [Maribacter zhoushanensis]MDF4201601.1 hypothetical protein [Maribacter zhoushanensis]